LDLVDEPLEHAADGREKKKEKKKRGKRKMVVFYMDWSHHHSAERSILYTEYGEEGSLLEPYLTKNHNRRTSKSSLVRLILLC
jgi:hypothetical protein